MPKARFVYHLRWIKTLKKAQKKNQVEEHSQTQILIKNKI